MATQHHSLSHFNKEEIPNCKSLKIALVVSQWNQEITNKLKEGAEKTLIECGLQEKNILIYHVPGSYELIFGAKIAAKKNPDAIICLGSVIQGETKHFDFVCNAVSNGIKDLNMALATISSLNAHKSSIEPPPLPIIRTSTQFLELNNSIALEICFGASSPCTFTDLRINLT